jgi:hypothetical protein
MRASFIGRTSRRLVFAFCSLDAATRFIAFMIFLMLFTLVTLLFMAFIVAIALPPLRRRGLRYATPTLRRASAV